MPFIPLGSRKNAGVLVDDEKQLATSLMRQKDNATVNLHHQVMAGTSSYRYAKHPETMGPVRGPPAPFKAANKPWTSAEQEPNGMAAMRDLEQAPMGACRDGGHCFHGETLRKSRSTPAMIKTLAAAGPQDELGKSLGEQAKEMANPLSIELNRWKRLAEVTKRDLATMPELHSTMKIERPPHKKPLVSGGLVNFPKYMLFENSHLKQQDFMRFVAAEEQARKEHEERVGSAEEAMGKDKPSALQTPISTSRVGSQESSEPSVPYATVSWGAPNLRGPDMKNQWAGSALPSGKSIRSSNPFRMG